MLFPKVEVKCFLFFFADNVQFNTTEKCGGKIEVNYRNKWEKVCLLQELSTEFKEKLCQELRCGAAINNNAITETKSEQVSLCIPLFLSL